NLTLIRNAGLQSDLAPPLYERGNNRRKSQSSSQRQMKPRQTELKPESANPRFSKQERRYRRQSALQSDRPSSSRQATPLEIEGAHSSVLRQQPCVYR